MTISTISIAPQDVSEPFLNKKKYNYLIRSFSRHACFYFIYLIAFLYSFAASAEEKGLSPLNITNNFPTAILFSNYTPESTALVKKGAILFRFGVTEANTIITDKSDTAKALVDLELTRLHLNIFSGVTDNLEFGLELPFLYYHRGFMDTPIEWFEDRIGKSSRPRKARRKNDIRFLLIKDGETIYNIKSSSAGPGDITLKFKYLLCSEGEYIPDASIKFDLSVPTGNENKLLGAGEPSFGPAILLHKSYKKIHLQLNFSYLVINDIEFQDSTPVIDTSNFFNSLIAIEYAMTDISWIVQFSASSNPLKKFGIEDISNSGQAISVGFKKIVSRYWVFQFALTENISSVAYPDFAADVLLEYRFNY